MMTELTNSGRATVERYRAPGGGMGDEDRFYGRCECGWKGVMHSNRTIEGRKLADRDARNHRCPDDPATPIARR